MVNMYTWEPLFPKRQIEKLYIDEFHTKKEISEILNVNVKVIETLIKKYGIKTRVAYKRNQYGCKNLMWKGKEAGYQALHLRVSVSRGKPMVCLVCSTTDKNKTYEWANLSGKYYDVNDYKRMCRSCHSQYAAKRRS